MNPIPIVALGLMLSARLCAAGPATAPSGRPSPEAVKRAETLHAGVKSFRLDLWYGGPQDKPFYALTLSVAAPDAPKTAPFHPSIQISEKQAGKIIDYLAGEGFLDRATGVRDRLDPRAGGVGPAYHLRVTAGSPDGQVGFHENLGFDLAMLRRLDGLRGALDAEAAEQMDFVLTRLSGCRKEWEKAAATKAKAAQASQAPDSAAFLIN